MPCRVRTAAEVTALLDGVELLDPGLVLPAECRPDGEVPADRQRITYAAVGRKISRAAARRPQPASMIPTNSAPSAVKPVSPPNAAIAALLLAFACI